MWSVESSRSCVGKALRITAKTFYLSRVSGKPVATEAGRSRSELGGVPLSLMTRFSGNWFGDHRVYIRRYRNQHLFFANDQSGAVVAGKLEPVAVRDRVGGAGLYAIAAKNAAAVIDVVDACVSLTAAESNFFRIFSGFDIDAVCGASSRAEKASDALFKPIFIALKNVFASESFFEPGRSIRIVFRDRGRHHLLERHTHAFGNCCC